MKDDLKTDGVKNLIAGAHALDFRAHVSPLDTCPLPSSQILASPVIDGYPGIHEVPSPPVSHSAHLGIDINESPVRTPKPGLILVNIIEKFARCMNFQDQKIGRYYLRSQDKGIEIFESVTCSKRVSYHDIDHLSIVYVGDDISPWMLIFIAGIGVSGERTYLVRSSRIRFHEFPLLFAPTKFTSLKYFIVYLLQQNARITTDRYTLGILCGGSCSQAAFPEGNSPFTVELNVSRLLGSEGTLQQGRDLVIVSI